MVFRSRQHIRFSDVDGMGHVNNATFLTYLEGARLEMLTSLPRALVAGGLIVARVECDYVRPIVADPEPVDVSAWVEQIGRSSFALGYTIHQRGTLVARARSVQVAYDYTEQRSRPLTDEERAALESARSENPWPEAPEDA